MPGRVDQGHAGQAAAGHLDDEPVQVLGAQRAEVEDGRARRPGGTGSAAAAPPRGCAHARSAEPSRYQVTTRVHSPASVAASRSPTSALSSVDLPALTRPAIATRSGSSSRRDHRVEPGLLRRAGEGAPASCSSGRIRAVRQPAVAAGRVIAQPSDAGGLAQQGVDQPPRPRGQLLQPVQLGGRLRELLRLGPGLLLAQSLLQRLQGSAWSTCAARPRLGEHVPQLLAGPGGRCRGSRVAGRAARPRRGTRDRPFRLGPQIRSCDCWAPRQLLRATIAADQPGGAAGHRHGSARARRPAVRGDDAHRTRPAPWPSRARPGRPSGRGQRGEARVVARRCPAGRARWCRTAPAAPRPPSPNRPATSSATRSASVPGQPQVVQRAPRSSAGRSTARGRPHLRPGSWSRAGPRRRRGRPAAAP